MLHKKNNTNYIQQWKNALDSFLFLSSRARHTRIENNLLRGLLQIEKMLLQSIESLFA